MATGCDVPIPVTTVDDFQFVLSTCSEDARRPRARTISYRWAVTGTPDVAKVHSLNQCSKGKRVNYGYSYG